MHLIWSRYDALVLCRYFVHIKLNIFRQNVYFSSVLACETNIKFQCYQCAAISTVLLAIQFRLLLSVSHDANLNFNSHVKNACKCFQTHALRYTRSSFTCEMDKFGRCSLVQSWFDYQNALHVGMSSTNIDILHRIQNTIAGPVTIARKRYHITQNH